MNTTTIRIAEKRPYSIPHINRIRLDNEISLTLNSNIAPGDPEGLLKTSEHFNNDPFKFT